MKNLLTLAFFVLFANFCVAENTFTVAPSGAKSDTIKPKRNRAAQPLVNPSQNPDKMDGRVKSVPHKNVEMEEAINKDAVPNMPNTTQQKTLQTVPKAVADTTDPKKAKKAAEKAAAEVKKAEEKKKKEEKDKVKPPRVHLFAWLSLGLGIVAIGGLIGYFIMPILGFASAVAILASIFGYLGSKKIKKDPLKWKGLPFTTFGGMSILALLAVAVVALVSFFRANSGI